MASGRVGCVVLFGGGRWARTVLQVLRQVAPKELEVMWVTKHLYSSSQEWLTQSGLSGVEVCSEIKLSIAKPIAAIVATSAETHCALARQCLLHRIPTLCEKPIAYEQHQAEELFELAASSSTPFGVQLEFLYASYLHDFAEQLRNVRVQSIAVDWYDPEIEQRGDIVKFPERYCDLISDQLPHCWSLLQVLEPSLLEVAHVEQSGDVVSITGSVAATAVTCNLSRYAQQRTRRILVNAGEWILDFSNEPGFIRNGETIQELTWTGERPLARSLRSFLNVATGAASVLDWACASRFTDDATRAAMCAAELLRQIQDGRLETLERDSFRGWDEPVWLRLIVDRYLPEFASKGMRFPVRTEEERLAFARWWIEQMQRERAN